MPHISHAEPVFAEKVGGTQIIGWAKDSLRTTAKKVVGMFKICSFLGLLSVGGDPVPFARLVAAKPDHNI
jgi:hypothetical protein